MQVERKICFPAGGKLKILQVSDPQDMHMVRSTMVRMLNAVYDREKPDLVVFTGDNILGNHIDDAPFGPWKNKKRKVTERRIRKALDHILKPLDKRQIPYCMIYGNHDDMNVLTKQEQAEFYKAHPYFFGLNDTDEDVACDTYHVPIYDSKGETVIYNLWMLDSAGQPEKEGEKAFTGVKPATIRWYIRTSDALKAQNGGRPVPSLMFQHIPVIETKRLFIPCDKDDPHAVRVPGEAETYAKLDPEQADGFAFEYPCTCEIEAGQLTAIRQQDDVCALVFGHDHMNCFTAQIDGVNLVQSPGASFRCFGNPVSRAVRVFEIDEDKTDVFRTRVISYFDLFGKKFMPVLRYIMCADEREKTRNLIWILLAALGAAFVLYLLGSFHFLQL